MGTFLLVVHIIVIVFLTAVVLMQSSKGGGLGAGFGGGGGDTLFGSSGSGNFLTKLTSVLALAFMVTSITLTVQQSKKGKSSVFDAGTAVQESVPAENSVPAGDAVPAPAENAPTSEKK